MFPSCGLFAAIICPLLKRGLCDRPHCLYKHAREEVEMLGSSYKPPVADGAGVQFGATVRGGTRDVCLRELEWINKEIETMKHEVEQEQRRLSHYRVVQGDRRNAAEAHKFLVSNRETGVDDNVDGYSYGRLKCAKASKTHSQARKYVLDNSKPRTDLEYDPMSNFSADLRSFSSSNKEHEVKTGQDLKREKHSANGAQKKQPYQIPLSRSPSPDFSDSNEDGILIIDVGIPSHEKMKGQALTSESPGGSCQDRMNRVCSTENKLDLSTCQSEQCEFAAVDEKVIDLTGGFEDEGTEYLEKSPELLDAPVTPDEQDRNSNEPLLDKTTHLFESRQSLMPCSNEQIPLQPFGRKKCVSHNTSAANSYSPYWPQPNKVQKIERPILNTADNLKLPKKSPTSVTQNILMASNAAQLQDKTTIDHSLPLITQVVSLSKSQTVLPASAQMKRAELPSTSTDQLLTKENDADVILIESSSEDEVNYSDVELSDTDPMEECYRIFMEANAEKKEEQPIVSVGNAAVEKPDVNAKPQGLAGRKRVAHESRPTEQPVAKIRPQPQVLVPFRGPMAPRSVSHPTIPSMFRRMEWKPPTTRDGQPSIFQRKPETQCAPLPAHPSTSSQPAPVENAYVSCVIDVGNSLHLILPDGTFPLPSTSSSVTSVVTPISQVHKYPVAMKQTYQQSGVAFMQRQRTAPPVIPPVACKPSLAVTNSSARTPAQVHSIVKPVATKRKVKQSLEVMKVPHDVRQRHVNMFTEVFLKTTADVNEAFEKAVAEERTVYNRSANKLRYLSVAVNSLKKLRNQSASAAKDENQANSQRSRGNIPLNLHRLEGNDDVALYECLKHYIMTEEMLIESNFPLKHPEKPGCAVLFNDNKKSNLHSLKRICCRCGATYSVNQMGKHVRKEECTYHYGKGVENRVPGGVETRYSCCEGVMGAPGCQVYKLHVDDSFSLDGFVSTEPRRPTHTRCPGVFSLDCEMCYTIHGLELSRVTVVNSDLQVVYDTFVKPDNEVVDYNTRFSGVHEQDVKGNCSSLRKVQETLLSFISADTILIGHGLETDFCVLKLIHGMVVDTSVVFPHHLGPPHKLTLNSLTAENLRRIIQERVCGHDTAEDATACMELMLWKVKEDGKLKK